LPGPTSGGTDTHLYFGWYHGRERDLPQLLRTFPRLGRFVSEFGSQSIPESDAFIDATRWPTLDWDALGRQQGLQKGFFDRNVPPSDYVHYNDWKRATQRHQVEVLRRHIEEMRRIKYRPNGGFALFLFADALDHPAVTWSVLGHDRVAKPAYEAVTDACRPVIVTADRPPAVVSVNDKLSLDIHVVSDVRHALKGATVRARMTWPGGSHAWAWTGDIAADRVTRIGAVDLIVPSPAHPASSALKAVPGVTTPTSDLVLDLTLEHPDHTATNRYVSRFV
jgi:beta-mannosidase